MLQRKAGAPFPLKICYKFNAKKEKQIKWWLFVNGIKIKMATKLFVIFLSLIIIESVNNFFAYSLQGDLSSDDLSSNGLSSDDIDSYQEHQDGRHQFLPLVLAGAEIGKMGCGFRCGGRRGGRFCSMCRRIGFSQ